MGRTFYDGGVTTVYLGLGSNLGDRRALLGEAVRRLVEHGAIGPDVVRSALYETDAVAPEPQPPYLNAVVRGRTSLSPEALLGACLRVEAELGRARPPGVEKAPRTVDIDVLLVGDAVIRTASLTVPHPRLVERAFVRIPLCDVAEPGLRDPSTGVTLTMAPPSPAVRKVTGPAGGWGQ